MEQVKIGFLGAGNMGSAIMRGIAGSKLSEQVALYAYDHMPEKTAALAATARIIWKATVPKRTSRWAASASSARPPTMRT